MWIKLTIILGIITICDFLLTKIMATTMEPDEQVTMALGGYPPKRVSIPIYIMFLSAIATVVCLIITIVTW